MSRGSGTKRIVIAFILGVVVGAAGMWIFGDQLRDNVADATEQLGDGVQGVGEKLEKTGDEIR